MSLFRAIIEDPTSITTVFLASLCAWYTPLFTFFVGIWVNVGPRYTVKNDYIWPGDRKNRGPDAWLDRGSSLFQDHQCQEYLIFQPVTAMMRLHLREIFSNGTLNKRQAKTFLAISSFIEILSK